MPADVPAEKLFEPHSSEPRNPNIANVFFKAGYVESWGRGYKNITEICEFRNAVLPLPEENCGGLAVECLPSKEYLEAERNKGKIAQNVTQEQSNNNLPKELPKDCPKTAQRTFNAIKSNPNATLDELSAELKLSVRTIKTHISLLKENGFIERIGGKTHGYWEILEQSS